LTTRKIVVKLKIPVLAIVVLLASGCAAINAGAPPATREAHVGRTRAEVHAEAVEAAKHHKSTLQEEVDFFNQYAR
jgi:hypothetical protein